MHLELTPPPPLTHTGANHESVRSLLTLSTASRRLQPSFWHLNENTLATPFKSRTRGTALIDILQPSQSLLSQKRKWITQSLFPDKTKNVLSVGAVLKLNFSKHYSITVSTFPPHLQSQKAKYFIYEDHPELMLKKHTHWCINIKMLTH